MKVFVWHRVDNSEGWLIVFAETEERARELANAEIGCDLKPGEAPDEVRDEVRGGGECVLRMPNVF